MKPTVDKLFKAALDYAQQTIVVEQNQLPATWVIIDKEGVVSVLVLPWRDEKEKLLVEMLVRLEIKERQAVAYGCVTEAWAATAPKGWQPGDEIDYQPRHNPNRREIVLAFVNDGESITNKMWNIKRDWHDRVVSLEPEKVAPEPFGGWMTTLLEK